MSEAETIAEFSFVTNKSFRGPGNPITIPSRFYEAIKKKKLLAARPAVIVFRDGAPIDGSIYTGWRAGGQYYQIRIAAGAANLELGRLIVGTSLRVRLLKAAEDWIVELK